MIEKLLGHYKVPDLKAGQTYYCIDKGSDNFTKKVIEENNYAERTKNGELVKREYSLVEVCACCEGDIGIWNEGLDEDVPFEMVFTPA
ncbi:hypothetical protein D3C87_504990 [compost metagenome]